MANFTDFNYATPAANDYIVGYKGDGTVEQRSTFTDLISTGLMNNALYSPQGGSVAINDGQQTVANSSFVQGTGNNAIGFYSAALGASNNVKGQTAFAQGNSNTASGEGASALGQDNKAEGQNSHVTGNYNIATGFCDHTVGQKNFTGGYTVGIQSYGGTHAEGRNNIVAVPYAHAEGFNNRIGYARLVDWYAINPSRFGFGFQGINSIEQLNIYGLNSTTLSSTVRLFFTDDTGNNTYSAYVSSISANYNDPLMGGPSFTIFLKNDSSALLPNQDFYSPTIYCVPITAYDGSTSFSNIGVMAHAEGSNNFAAGNYAHVQGLYNSAAGLASHASGQYSSTGNKAAAAHAMGDTCYANGIRSFALGYKSVANHDNSYVWNGSPNIPNPGFLYSTASGQYIVNAPGGIYLSGAPVYTQGIVQQDWSKNITNNSNVFLNSNANGPLSGGITLGYANSASDSYGSRAKALSFNLGTSIHGYANLVDSAATDVNGLNNYVVADGSNVKGIGNVAAFYNSSVEGAVNTIGRIYTIVKTVSATNSIFVSENFSQTNNAQGFLPVGAKILIDGHASGSGNIINASSPGLRRIFTVASVSPDLRSFTVIEPITAMGIGGVGYSDDQPYSDRRYVVAIGAYAGSNNTNVQGSHAEGILNYSLNRASHAEGQNNAATGVAAHAEGIGNYATTLCHAEGQETRAGYNIFYWDSYNAATKTFQLFTNALSSFNSADVSSINVGNVLFLITTIVGTTSTRRNITRVPVLSTDPVANTITAVSAVFADNVTSAGFTRDRHLLNPFSNSTHAEGFQTVARGTGSHAEGLWTLAQGIYSHAAGRQAAAKHDYAYAWSSGSGTSTSLNFETTRAEQYAISANGGVYIPGNVGIGTDSIANALTVKGTVSASNVIADSISYTGADFNNLPTYKTYQTNVMVKNANYTTLSASLTAETGYFDSQGAYAMQGAMIIKGHAKAYDNIPLNLTNISWPWANGAYGLAIQNVNSMDPGTTFICDGRAQVTHGMTFRAGNNTFTGGSDHNHVMWTGSPSNNTQTWQMTNGGNWTTQYGQGITNRFMVHTLPQYQISTTITATSGYVDTTTANYDATNTNNITGVKLIVSYAETNNYSLLGAGDVIGLTVNPGIGGLVAVTYQSQIISVSSNNVNLSAYTLTLYGSPNLLNLNNRGLSQVSLVARANGGNPGVFKITSQIGTPATQYVGLTGNYKNVPKHVLARFTTSSLLTGLKSGSPLTLWIPSNMPSSLGTGFVTSTVESSPTNFRYGYFDAFVKTVSGTDVVFSIGSLMDTYNFTHRTWTSTVAGNAGWVLYGGSQDTVHRPTFGTTGFYFEREPYFYTSTDNFAFLSGGMVKNACLGNSESYGNYSYGLGYRGTVLGDKSATLAGDMSYVYGNNSVAIGGEGLVSLSGTQVVIGQYNDPNTNSLFVVGSGTSDTNRKNVYEVTGNGDTKQSGFAIRSFSLISAAGNNQATASEIRTEIVTVTGGSGGVRLPVSAGGHVIYVKNIAPANTFVYAPVGGSIRNYPSGFQFAGEGIILCTSLSAGYYDIFQ